MPSSTAPIMMRLNTCALALDDCGLWIEDRIVIGRVDGQFTASSSLKNRGEAFRTLQRIASLLNKDKKAEAIFLATFAFSKAGFNQDETRDRTGEWARETAPDAASLFGEIADNNSAHDALVNDIAGELRMRGSIVETEIRLSNLAGITARGDIMVRPHDGEPYLLEVKTGFDSRFRLHQILIYRDMCLGPHVFSPDERITNLGFKTYALLPKMRVYFHFSVMGHHYYGDYCELIGVAKTC